MNVKDKDYKIAFEKLKTLLKNRDFTKTFTLVTDASNLALGAELMQGNKVVFFASLTLNGHEKNYGTIEKELLVIA